MPSVIETITSVEDRVVDTLKSVQEPVVGAVSKVAEYAGGLLPDDRPDLPFVDQLPTLTELVESQYAFARRLLEVNHQFAKALVSAVAPVTGETPKAKPAGRTAKAA